MSGTEEKIRLAVGSAAAAAAIFAPLTYKWKSVLTGVAAGAILTGGAAVPTGAIVVKYGALVLVNGGGTGCGS